MYPDSILAMALWRRVRYTSALQDHRKDASHLEAFLGKATQT